MRNALLLIGFLSLGIAYSFSQEDEDIYTFVDEEARFTGGMGEMYKFLNKNMVYPTDALSAGIEGKVTLKFVVEKDGSIGTVQVLRGISECPKCNEEAVRVVKSMPNWIPAKTSGKAIRSYYQLPINFKLPK